MPRTNSIHELKGRLEPEQLHALLSESYPRFPSRVTRVLVAPVPPPKKGYRAAAKMFEQAFARNNEGLHHGYLKWFGLHWCTGASSSKFQKYRYEARIAYPKQLEPALSSNGKGEVIGEGVVLPPRHRYFLDACIEKVADIFGIEQIVECGKTDLSRFVLPLAARVANRVLWIPHPHKDVRADWSDFSSAIEGLLIERQPGISAAVTPSNHYPLRILKNGKHTVLLGCRDCRAQISSSGAVSVTYYESAS